MGHRSRPGGAGSGRGSGRDRRGRSARLRQERLQEPALHRLWAQDGVSAALFEPTPGHLAQAATALREGRLVAFPTETVYGLGGDATSDRAVAAIYAAKGRPSFNPLIVHVGTATAAGRLVEMTTDAELLAERFWP